MPARVQLSRRAGWRMPEGAVTVARPGKWGNPFRAGDPGIPDRETAVRMFRQLSVGEIGEVEYPFADVGELRGKDLACWCSLAGPCHADVLLELANS